MNNKRRIVFTLAGLVLVATQFWRSVRLSVPVYETKKNDAFVGLPKASTTRQEVVPDGSQQQLVIDILSIGSNHRPDYLEAQREILAQPHNVVRYFVGATQDDSFEPACEQQLNATDVQTICEFCKVPATSTDNIYQPGSILQLLRARYASWKGISEKHHHPVGWLCAQRRLHDAMYKLLQFYNDNNNEAPGRQLPDFLFIMDDDTYMQIPAVVSFLQTLYMPSARPTFMAGCLVRYLHNFPEFMTIPFGGWGTILSKGTLQNWLRPIDCSSDKNNNKDDDFIQNACHRLDQNLLHEQSYYQPNMSVADLIHAYQQTNMFQNYATTWNDTHNFCLHSDWMTGYFGQYYHTAEHTGDPYWARNIPQARMTSYRKSEIIANLWGALPLKKRMALEGQCRFQKEECTAESSHICHYVTPEQMYNLSRHQQQQNDVKSATRTTAMTTTPMIQHPDWKAMWMRPNESSSSPPITTSATIVAANTPTRTATTPASTTQNTITPIFVYPFMNHTIEHELKHYIWDGIQQSSRLTMSEDSNTTHLWMLDVHRARFHSPRYCTRVAQLAAKAAVYKEQYNMLQHWKIILLYWEDEPLNDFLECFRFTRLVDSLRVFRYKRSMVVDRDWDATIQFVAAGQELEYGNWREHSASPVQPIHCGVRSDIVEGMMRLFLGYNDENKSIGTTSLPSDPLTVAEQLVLKLRTTDVSYFWPRKGQDDQHITSGKGSQLRHAVSETLYEMMSNSRTYNIFLGLTGQADDVGRNQAHDKYLEKMLASKIVVVAQKDQWEDDYQLMEALSSGALVLTDPMLSLPEGLEDGRSIVVYKSLHDLVTKIDYYLNRVNERQRIALEGFRIAMSQHRSWHMMEKIVFEDLSMG